MRILATLSPAQRDVVTRLVRETAYSVIYWPLVKVRNLPGVALRVLADRIDEDGTTRETFELDHPLDPHQVLTEWVNRFADFLSPESALEGRWKDLLITDAERPEALLPFTGDLVEGSVLFTGQASCWCGSACETFRCA